MANPANKTKDQHAPGSKGTDQMRAELNNVIDSLRLLTAKLDADAGVTDTTYRSLITDTGIATAPAKIL